MSSCNSRQIKGADSPVSAHCRPKRDSPKRCRNCSVSCYSVDSGCTHHRSQPDRGSARTRPVYSLCPDQRGLYGRRAELDADPCAALERAPLPRREWTHSLLGSGCNSDCHDAERRLYHHHSVWQLGCCGWSPVFRLGDNSKRAVVQCCSAHNRRGPFARRLDCFRHVPAALAPFGVVDALNTS